MVSENEDCHRKSKLTITVKTLNKYNDRSSQAAQQTRKKNSEAQTKHTNK